MASLLLDPFVLAIPSADASRDDVEEYVQDLLDWSVLRRESWASIYMSERALECLDADGCFPIFTALRAAFGRHGIDHLDVNTVVQVVNFILAQTPYLEDRFGIREILADPITVRPDIPGRRILRRIGDELARCLAILALVATRVPERVREHRLATRDAESEDGRLSVAATILDAELTSTCAFAPSSYPIAASYDVVACEHFEDFLLSVDPAALWMASARPGDSQVAIRLSIFARAREAGQPISWDATHQFSIGREFHRRVEAAGFLTNQGRMNALLRATADTVLGLNMTRTHALREGAGGNAPQRTRGNDRAMRRDIDHEYHLHYWDCPGSRPEFAAVGPHNAFDIPY